MPASDGKILAVPVARLAAGFEVTVKTKAGVGVGLEATVEVEAGFETKDGVWDGIEDKAKVEGIVIAVVRTSEDGQEGPLDILNAADSKKLSPSLAIW